MNQELDKKVRRSVLFDDDCLKFVRTLAKDKNWPFDYTAYMLLKSAIKEKTRKKSPKSLSD